VSYIIVIVFNLVEYGCSVLINEAIIFLITKGSLRINTAMFQGSHFLLLDQVNNQN